MSEPGRGDRLAALLAEARDEVSRHVRPPGAGVAITAARSRRRRRTVAAGALAAALLAGPAAGYALAGREPADHPPGGGRPSTPDAAAVWRDFVECARAHGRPDWPDPVVSAGGAATFPGLDDKQAYTPALAAACGAILAVLPPEVRPNPHGN